MPEPRRVVDLPDLDPWSLLSALPAGEWALAWNDPVEARCLLGVGAHRVFGVEGGARFDQARAAVAHVAAAAAPGDDLPQLLGGFAYAADGGGDWGGGQLVAPELLIERRAGVCRAALQGPRAADLLAAMQSAARRSLRLVDCEAADDEPAAFVQAVDAATQAFANGQLEKVVLARASRRLAPQVDALATALRLRAAQPDCTTWCLRRPDGVAWLGATPEELARVQAGVVRTVALAGTRRRGATPAEDRAIGDELNRNPKDSHEQALVTEAIVAALSPLLERPLVPPPPSVAPYALLLHLRTALEAQLAPGLGLIDVVEALHPTPAVGGLPRAPALAWQQAHEPGPRGWYAGPIGWLDGRGDGVMAVGIRSAELRDGGLTAWAGCGLVAGSVPSSEWAETVLKLRAVTEALATWDARS